MKHSRLFCVVFLALSVADGRAFDNQEGAASFRQGVALLRQQSFRDAAIAFDKAVQDGVTGKQVYRCRGFARILSGKPAGAIDDFSKAVRTDQKDAALYYGRGEAYRLLGKNDEAVRDFGHAIELNQDYGAALCARSYLLRERGDSEAASRDFERWSKLLPDIRLGVDELARFAEKKGNLAQGAEVDLAFFPIYEWWSSLFREFRALEAGAQREAVADQAPADSKSIQLQALRAAVDGNLERALAVLAKAIQTAPKDAKTHQLRGILLAVKGDWKDALDAFSRALDADPAQLDWYLSRAAIYNELGEFEKGMQDTAVVERRCEENADDVPTAPVRGRAVAAPLERSVKERSAESNQATGP